MTQLVFAIKKQKSTHEEAEVIKSRQTISEYDRISISTHSGRFRLILFFCDLRKIGNFSCVPLQLQRTFSSLLPVRHIIWTSFTSGTLYGLFFTPSRTFLFLCMIGTFRFFFRPHFIIYLFLEELQNKSENVWILQSKA